MDGWGLDINIHNSVIDNIPEGGEELELLKQLTGLIDVHARNALNNDLIMENLQWLDLI